MVKNIILHLNDKMFFLMSQDKAKKETEAGMELTWENNVIKLFKLNGGSKHDRR